jgi:hypothetical protein
LEKEQREQLQMDKNDVTLKEDKGPQEAIPWHLGSQPKQRCVLWESWLGVIHKA